MDDSQHQEKFEFDIQASLLEFYEWFNEYIYHKSRMKEWIIPGILYPAIKYNPPIIELSETVDEFLYTIFVDLFGDTSAGSLESTDFSSSEEIKLLAKKTKIGIHILLTYQLSILSAPMSQLIVTIMQRFPQVDVANNTLPSHTDDNEIPQKLIGILVDAKITIRDRKILIDWFNGYTSTQISERLEGVVTGRTIINKVSKYRKRFGEEIVPTHR